MADRSPLPQTILITGASSGIGLAVARIYAQRGAALGLAAIPGEELERAAEELKGLGARSVFAFGLDVRDREAMRRAVFDFAQKAGSLDLFLACAGIDIDFPIEKFDAERAESIYHINFTGAMNGLHAALEIMLGQPNGHLAAIASLAALRIAPIHADYSASKAALDALMESLRLRLMEKPISVSTVYPGWVRTPMIADHTHPMPIIIEADKAARIIVKGLDARRQRIAFPRSLDWGMRIVRLIPELLWRLIVRRM